MLAKRSAADGAGVAIHFVGRLQSNKVRLVADTVAVWETVDRPSLVEELARRIAAQPPGVPFSRQTATTRMPADLAPEAAWTALSGG